MRRIPRNVRWLAPTLLIATAASAAIAPGDWKTRQSVAIQNSGVVRLALPVATLDATRPNLEDLRLLDPAGNEVPYMIERATRPAPFAPSRPVSFQSSLTDSATILMIEAKAGTPLEAILLSAPAGNFIKAARVEISPDGGTWTTVQEGTPIFRQGGVENLRIDLRLPASRYTRITVDDRRSPPVPFTQATLVIDGRLASATRSSPTFPPLPVARVRREEFAGESVFTLDLGGKNIPLAAIEFVTTEPLFMRPVTIGVRELRDGVAVERTLASGSIYRVAVDGLEPRARLEIPLEVVAPNREVLVHVANGDSPPLAATELKFRQFPIWLTFHTETAGNFTLLSGNPGVDRPRYDVASLGGLFRGTLPTDVTVGALEANPAYRITTPMGDTALIGGPLDPSPWGFRKPIRLGRSGVQELELDLDVLSHAQQGFADIRLVYRGNQLPYLLERPGLTRASPLAFTEVAAPNRPRTTRWEIKLPRAGLPLARVTISSPTPLFQRELHLFEAISDNRSGNYERTLAVASWNHAPGNDANLVLTLATPPMTDRLILETDNGDNQPIAIGTVVAAIPVTRLLFKADAAADAEPASTVSLYYGNRGVAPPRYDLALISTQIFAAEKSLATLGAEEVAQAGGWAAKALGGLQGGPLLWGVLALVVVVLLVVVAKLLPKPGAKPPAARGA